MGAEDLALGQRDLSWTWMWTGPAALLRIDVESCQANIANRGWRKDRQRHFKVDDHLIAPSSRDTEPARRTTLFQLSRPRSSGCARAVFAPGPLNTARSTPLE